MTETLYKYPQTKHFPWSESNTSDDAWLPDDSQFRGKNVVITEKMDGENTNLYRHHYHARSRDSAHHPSRSWVKQLHASIAHDIPAGFRICGENVFAYHSIWYWGLSSYFLVFGIYDDQNRCLSWKDTTEYAKMLGLETAPVLYRGPWDALSHKEGVLRSAHSDAPVWDGTSAYETYFITKPDYQDNLKSEYHHSTGEGYVVRTEEGFDFQDFARCTGKYVRKNHVQTSAFWMTQPVIPNRLQEES